MTTSKLASALIILTFSLGGSFLLTSCASTPTQESFGQGVDSSAITTAIKTKYLMDSDIKSLSISVYTFKGNVTLTGTVYSAAQKAKAISIAQGVNGVKSIRDNLVVKRY